MQVRFTTARGEAAINCGWLLFDDEARILAARPTSQSGLSHTARILVASEVFTAGFCIEHEDCLANLELARSCSLERAPVRSRPPRVARKEIC